MISLKTKPPVGAPDTAQEPGVLDGMPITKMIIATAAVAAFGAVMFGIGKRMGAAPLRRQLAFCRADRDRFLEDALFNKRQLGEARDVLDVLTGADK